MDRETVVYVDLDGKLHLVGRLRARARKNQESASFEYDKTWLENPLRFSLEPALRIGPGAFHTPAETPMFGAITDSAPDRWGRTLMRRAERRQAERVGTAPSTLQQIDFLLLVDDEARAPFCGKRGRTISAAGGGQSRSASCGAARIALRRGARCR